jgi:hypothetical protein
MTPRIVLAVISIVVLTPAHQAFANAETDGALNLVQKDMSRPGFDKEAAKMSPEASKIVNSVNTMTGGNAEDTQAIFQLASEIMASMQTKSPEEMMKLINEAKSNPEAFASKWSPEQKRKLRELSDRLNNRTPSSPR